MFYQEKQTIVSLISTMITSAFYFVEVFDRYQAKSFSTKDELAFWAAAILIFIPVQVVFKIIIHIAFSIINTIATREEEPLIIDERDRLIDLKATRNFYHVFMAGFLLSMGSLVMDMPPMVMFTVLILSMVIAGMVLDLSQLYFYRRGV